jgi:hypothetical protein
LSHASVEAVRESENRPSPDEYGALQSGASLVESDEEGAFEISDIGPGTYSFRVGARDGERSYSRIAKNNPVTVRGGESITGLELVVAAADEEVIEGYVRNEEGISISGASVDAGTGTSTSGSTRTDVSGHYRLERIGAGDVELHFSHPSYADAWLKDIPVGTMDANVVMPRRGGISGVVMDAVTRKPLRDFDVMVAELRTDAGTDVTRRSDLYLGSRRRDSGVGRFVIDGLIPGIATIRASASGYAPQEVSNIVVQSGKTTTANVYLTRGGVIEGYVTRNGAPVTMGTTITACTVSDPGHAAGRSMTDRSGFYRIEALMPDTYMVIAEIGGANEGGATIRSARTQVVGDRVVRLDFDLGGSASLRGKVSSPQRYGMIGVIVRHESATEPFSFETWSTIQGRVLGWKQCAPDGSYEITDLPAGTYNVTAVRAPEWESPDIRQTSRTVTLEEGQRAEVNFEL